MLTFQVLCYSVHQYIVVEMSASLLGNSLPCWIQDKLMNCINYFLVKSQVVVYLTTPIILSTTEMACVFCVDNTFCLAQMPSEREKIKVGLCSQLICNDEIDPMNLVLFTKVMPHSVLKVLFID